MLNAGTERPFFYMAGLFDAKTDKPLRDTIVDYDRKFLDYYAQLIRTIRSVCECPIVMGGSGFSVMPAELMERLSADLRSGKNESSTKAG